MMKKLLVSFKKEDGINKFCLHGKHLSMLNTGILRKSFGLQFEDQIEFVPKIDAPDEELELPESLLTFKEVSLYPKHKCLYFTEVKCNTNTGGSIYGIYKLAEDNFLLSRKNSKGNISFYVTNDGVTCNNTIVNDGNENFLEILEVLTSPVVQDRRLIDSLENLLSKKKKKKKK